MNNADQTLDTSGIRTHARRLVPKTSALDRSAIVSSVWLEILNAYKQIQTLLNSLDFIYMTHL